MCVCVCTRMCEAPLSECPSILRPHSLQSLCPAQSRQSSAPGPESLGLRLAMWGLPAVSVLEVAAHPRSRRRSGVARQLGCDVGAGCTGRLAPPPCSLSGTGTTGVSEQESYICNLERMVGMFLRR